LTPDNSGLKEFRTPDIHTFDRQDLVEYPPTPGDGLQPLPQYKRDDIFDRLLAPKEPRDRLKVLDEDYLMELRSSIDRPTALPFDVDINSFLDWQHESSDLGGYEYDAQREKVIIKTLPGSIHEAVVSAFNEWFVPLKRKFRQRGVELKLKSNKGLPPILNFNNF
jgi:hypothetical protein